MPIIYVPDNTPSRNYGRNSRTEGFAHPAHGTLGGLAKSDTDPRNRGRRRSREEIEDSSRARSDAKRERLAKLREEVETKKGAEKEAKEAKRLRVTADKSAAALANNPEAARREVARQDTVAAANAKKGQPLKRLTPEEIAANEKAINAREAAAKASAQAESKTRAGMMDKLMSERMKPEGPSLSDTLAASEAAGKPFINRPSSNYTPPVVTPAAATPAEPTAPPMQQEEARAEPTVFTSREKMLRAAMNPSGRRTPEATPRGSLDSTPGMSNAVAEATLPQGKNTMSPSEREFVDSQQRGLGLDAMLYTAPTGLVDWYANTLSRENPTADSPLLGNTTPEYRERISREISPEPSSIYTTPSYLRDNFRFDSDQSKVSTYKDSPEYQSDVGQGKSSLEVPESFKQSMRFRPGMEFGEPASRPTAIGANATGIGAGRPERKKEKFMDWLRANFPDSFSDPNSMYYFPGKFY